MDTHELPQDDESKYGTFRLTPSGWVRTGDVNRVFPLNSLISIHVKQAEYIRTGCREWLALFGDINVDVSETSTLDKYLPTVAILMEELFGHTWAILMNPEIESDPAFFFYSWNHCEHLPTLIKSIMRVIRAAREEFYTTVGLAANSYVKTTGKDRTTGKLIEGSRWDYIHAECSLWLREIGWIARRGRQRFEHLLNEGLKSDGRIKELEISSAEAEARFRIAREQAKADVEEQKKDHEAELEAKNKEYKKNLRSQKRRQGNAQKHAALQIQADNTPEPIQVGTVEVLDGTMEVLQELRCKKCGSKDVIKRGMMKDGKQRFGCKVCKCIFCENPQKRSYSEERKAEILRSYQEGVSLRGLTCKYGVSRQTVSVWLKQSG